MQLGDPCPGRKAQNVLTRPRNRLRQEQGRRGTCTKIERTSLRPHPTQRGVRGACPKPTRFSLPLPPWEQWSNSYWEMVRLHRASFLPACRNSNATILERRHEAKN